MNRIGLMSLLAVSTVTTLLAGCGKDEPPPQQPQAFQGQYPQQPGQYPQQPGQYPQQPGQYPQQQPAGYPQQQPAGYPQQQPGAQPGQAPAGGLQIPGLPGAAPAGAAGGSAQALDPNVAQLAVVPLQMFANSEAPGMTKEGNPIAGNFQEGQTLEAPFTLTPGKCYTVVAVGAPPLSGVNLEIQYVTPIPGISPSAGKSTQTGTQASIGGKGNCLKPLSPFPANAKFILRAAKGSGVAAAQLYSK